MARHARHRTINTALGLAAACVLTSSGGALAQTQGGTLRATSGTIRRALRSTEGSRGLDGVPIHAGVQQCGAVRPGQPTGTLDTIVPDLAKNWVWDATRTKVTFKLEEGVRWHDGKPLPQRM
jgi:peptide/nickel transport system substrate-binding protein